MLNLIKGLLPWLHVQDGGHMHTRNIQRQNAEPSHSYYFKMYWKLENHIEMSPAAPRQHVHARGLHKACSPEESHKQQHIVPADSLTSDLTAAN